MMIERMVVYPGDIPEDATYYVFDDGKVRSDRKEVKITPTLRKEGFTIDYVDGGYHIRPGIPKAPWKAATKI